MDAWEPPAEEQHAACSLALANVRAMVAAQPLPKRIRKRSVTVPKRMREAWATVQGLDPDNLTKEDVDNMREDCNGAIGADLGPFESNVLHTVPSWDRRIEPHPFVSLYQHEIENAASNKALGAAGRVFVAALARCTENGHAPFEAGELSKLTGLRAKDALGAAIEKAVPDGLLAPESTARCLVVGRVRRPLSGRQDGAPECVHRAA